MSAEAAALIRTFPVGPRVVTMTVQRPKRGDVCHVTCEWDPSPPQQLSKAERHQYRAGRDAALRELAELTGLRTAVIEI